MPERQLAIGLGCQRGCPAAELHALIDASLAEHGLSLDAVQALASIDLKRQEPGLLELAAELGIPVQFFDATELQGYEAQLSHRSATAFAHTGCYGVAESSALAMAARLGSGQARLLIPRRHSTQATFALAFSASGNG